MRVIAGTARGTALRAPKGEATRPTTDRVRSSLFSLLGDRVKDARVLDLFAGCGTLGIECLSRGATSATFVESGKEAAACIRGNLERARLTAGGQLVVQSVEAFLTARGRTRVPSFDLIFADPPYATRPGDMDFGAWLVASPELPNLLAQNGIFIVEAPRNTPDPQSPVWELVEARNYGTNCLQFFQLRPVSG